MFRTSNKHTISVNLDLSYIWSRFVESKQITSEFNAPLDDPEGRWKGGDKILFGITNAEQGFCGFAKNLSTGKIITAPVEEKEVSGTEFRCRFNGYRVLRPGGSVSSIGRQPDISPNPTECRFYCRDPANPLSLLHRTPSAQVNLKHYLWNAYYNASPLELDGHFIWVPVMMSGNLLTLPHHLQTLNRAVIEDIFLLCNESANFALLFNSLHAGASVNHLHVHAVYRKHPLAIENRQATARDRFHVLEDYPAEGLMFQGSQAVNLVCEYAEGLQEMGIPFNLIWLDGRVFPVARDIEHEVTEEFPFDALSAMDMCGKITTTDRATYDSISKERIEAAFRKSTIAAGKFLRDWKG